MALSRRRLLALGGLLAAAPALAQAPRLRRIGILDYSAAEPGRLGWWKAFRQRLAELGYVEGRNLIVEARFAAGSEERRGALVAEVGNLNVVVLAVGGTINCVAVGMG